MSSEEDDLWHTYSMDASDALRTIEECLLCLETDPGRKDLLHRLYRALHTLKGNSALLNLTQIEALAHASEDLIGLVRDQGLALEPEMIELMLALLDRLRAVTEFASSEHRDVESDQVVELVARVHEWSASRGLRRSVRPQGATRGEILIWSDIPGSEEERSVHPLEDGPAPSKDADSIEMFLSLCRELLPTLRGGPNGRRAGRAAAARRGSRRLGPAHGLRAARRCAPCARPRDGSE